MNVRRYKLALHVQCVYIYGVEREYSHRLKTKTMYLIHESEEIDNVIGMVPKEKLRPEIVQMHEDGKIWGIYYDDGELVAKDIWGEVHKVTN